MKLVTIAAILLIIAVAAATTAADTPKPVRVSELQALAAKKLWAEVFDKLERVPAKERTAKWHGLLEKSSEYVISQGKAASEVTNLLIIDAVLKRYPPLKRSQQFARAARSELLVGLRDCLKHRRRAVNCAKLGQSIAARTAATQNQSMWKAGALIFTHGDAANSLRFFAVALEESKQSKRCSSKQVQTALIEAAKYPYADELAKLSRTVLQRQCISHVSAALRQALAGAHAKSALYDNLCPLMLEKGLVNGLQAKRCRRHIKK